MHDDYDIDDLPCPACGNGHTHSRPCSAFDCEDGSIDEHHDDPINYGPGEEYSTCSECHGHGIERWCPQCGADYWLAKDKALREGSIAICPSCKGSGNGDRVECHTCWGKGWVQPRLAAKD